ncbi:MAG: MBL fold metallo-hydrolase [Candidatus Zixiibacteriota bacterium]|nr:MAG: MBL fold metallo-hydrolase [candidate division Zixibacteria bacterium]
MRLKIRCGLVLTVLALELILLCSSGILAEDDTISSPGPMEEQMANPPGLGNPEVHQIAVNVYAVTGLYHPAGDDVGVSAGIIFADNSIVFIDAGMSVASGEFLWQLAEEMMAGDEDLYLILTHRHSDHVFGMRVVKEQGAKVIAHRILKDWFGQMGDRYRQFIVSKMGWDAERGDEILGEVLLFPPDHVIEHDTVLTLDGEEIHVLATPGHLYDELSVYHPNSKTLFAGDAVYQGIPPHTGFGGPEEWRLWISQLERLKQLEIGTVVPGHGKLCSKNEIDRNIACLKDEISKTK